MKKIMSIMLIIVLLVSVIGCTSMDYSSTDNSVESYDYDVEDLPDGNDTLKIVGIGVVGAFFIGGFMGAVVRGFFSN